MKHKEKSFDSAQSKKNCLVLARQNNIMIIVSATLTWSVYFDSFSLG
jgi:hypothetical protein